MRNSQSFLPHTSLTRQGYICREIEKLNYVNVGVLWGYEDQCFNLELENFGVDLDAINDTPAFPKRVTHYWIKKYEATLLQDNKVVAKTRLIKKYSGLVFTDNAEQFEKCYFKGHDVLYAM